MKIPRDLSGQELVQTLCGKWGYRVVHQEGSYVVLETDDPSHQRLAIPRPQIPSHRNSECHFAHRRDS